VQAINPKIVHAWITGFGKARSWRSRPSFDLLLQALSGQMFALGSKDAPIYSSIPMADLYGGMLTVYGIILALQVRERTGEGLAFTTNQAASSMAAQNGQFVRYAGIGPAGPDGNALGTAACRRYYQATDGWIALSVARGEQWSKLVGASGGALDPWADWVQASIEPAEGALAEALAALLSGLSRDDIAERFSRHGIPVAPVVVVREDRITNRYFRELGVLVEGLEHEVFGTITTVGDFYRFSATPSRTPDMTQWVGEHNRPVLAELGYSPAEIDHLAGIGAIAAPVFQLARV
jgi:crotonobetainyl-CoA:carnitine CoA-transferase CaiB-like acyl-CoA transferase